MQSKGNPGRQLIAPRAPEAEVAVLGAMLQEPLAIGIAIEESHLQPQEFFEPRHRAIAESICRLTAAGNLVDDVLVSNDLRRHGTLQEVGGGEYLDFLKGKPATLANIESWIRDIRNASIKRNSLSPLQTAREMACNGSSTQDLAKFLHATAAEIEQLSSEVSAPPRPRFELISAPAFKTRVPPEFLIEGLLVENTLSAMVGPSGTFKSFMALGIAGCVATGLPWHGQHVRRAPAVYISGEGSAGLGARQRAWEIANQHFMPESLYFLPQAAQLHNPDDIAALISAIRSVPEPPGLIVIDTLARCLVGGDENSAKDMGLFIAGADRLRTETGAHVMIIHHVGKKGDTRGSTALPGALDTMMGIERTGKQLAMKCLKQKDAPEFETMAFIQRTVELTTDGSETSLVFDPVGTVNQQGRAAQRASALLHQLSQYEKGLTYSAWSALALEEFNVKPRTFANYIKELTQNQQIMKTQDVYVRINYTEEEEC